MTFKLNYFYLAHAKMGSKDHTFCSLDTPFVLLPLDCYHFWEEQIKYTDDA